MPLEFPKGVPKARLALAFSCYAFPLFVYGVAFRGIGARRFFPDDVTVDHLGLAFKPQSATLLAADLAAREAFLLGSVLLIIVSFGAAAHALGAVFSSRGRDWAVFVGAFATFAAIIAAINHSTPMRSLLIDEPLRWTRTFGAADLRSGMSLMITVNTFAGMAAATAMMGRFADLALGPSPGIPQKATADRRIADIREAIFVSSAILTSATIATYAVYHYPLSLMTTEAAEAFGPIAQLASLRWGASYTAVLAAAALPAIAAQIIDRRKAVARGYISGDESPSGWFDRAKVAEQAKTLSVMIGVIAPAIATPVLEMIRRIVDAASG